MYDRIELIRGEIVKMAAKGTPHRVCCTKLIRELAKILGDKATLQCQDPIIIPSGSEPEPDFAIVKNKDDDYLSGHPTSEDIILVIEIADSSLNYDQEVKLSLYAEAGISNYWIFNLREYQLETYRKAYRKQQGSFAYSQKQIFLPSQTVSLPSFTDVVLDLAKVFPKIGA
ncbi:MAG: Uma2 family endonuclease [Moorea sp. SIO2B7]|nr:Uma2 family endonuclease [Moorena sp. SIO2B7]